MKRIFKILIITSIITIFNLSAVFAAAPTPNFTGWVSQAGNPTYYMNGNQVKNSWVKQGNTYYFLNADGNVVPNFIVNQDGIRYSGITAYLDTNNGGKLETVVPATPDTYKPVRDIYGVTSDYEAFKKRYSGYAEVYGNTDTSYQAYLNSYNGQAPGTKYLDAYMNYLTDTYNAHRYDHHYENMQNGTHKAYCECGAWTIYNCIHNIEHGVGGPYECWACGHMAD